MIYILNLHKHDINKKSGSLIPLFIRSEFIIKKETEDLVDLFTYFDPIREDTIYLNRLNSFLEEIGKPTVTNVRGYKCI